jgi:hypothetical protein
MQNMVKPGSLKTVEDCAAWIYEHDGRIEAWWDAQRDHNARSTTTISTCQETMQTKIKDMGETINIMGEKVDKMQKAIWIATGGTMMAGGIIGISVTIAVAFLNGD